MQSDSWKEKWKRSRSSFMSLFIGLLLSNRQAKNVAPKICQDSKRGEERYHYFKSGHSGHRSRGCSNRKSPSDKSGQVDMSASTVTFEPVSPVEKNNQSDVYKLITDSTQYLVTKKADRALDAAVQASQAVCVDLRSPNQRQGLLYLIVQLKVQQKVIPRPTGCPFRAVCASTADTGVERGAWPSVLAERSLVPPHQPHHK